MKLAVSNIAWSPSLDDEVFGTLQGLAVHALEVAPTRLWPDWQGAEPAAASRFRQSFADAGFAVPSLQAILFGKPDCKLFGSDAERANLVDHLRLCADLAVELGGRSLVLGAPKNRDRGGLSFGDAFRLGREIFAEAGSYYASRNVCLCLEANPAQYGCTFVTDSREAAALVRAVDSPGFRLHLDTACMFLAGENIPKALRAHRDILQHLHVSEPNLGDFHEPLIDHSSVAAALESLAYDGWITLEMREAGQPLAALSEAVEFVQKTYGCGL